MKKNKISLFVKSYLVLFLFSSFAIFAANPPGIPEGWSQEYVYVNGIRINYYKSAAVVGKPVIIMVHGVTDNGLCWANLSLKLQKDYSIYMLDTRGHGLSDPFTSSDDGETLLKDVVGFVKAMNIEKPVLMGHSMGAATVMRVGANYPDIARAIIMLDPFVSRAPIAAGVPARKPSNKEQDVEKSKSSEPKKISFSMFGDPETLVNQNNHSYDDFIALGKKQNSKWDILDIQYWALSKKQYHGAYTPAQQQAMSGIMKTENALQKITVPSIILKADTTPEGKKANEDAVAGLEKVKLVHMTGTGHNLHHDDLEATVSVITNFLSNLKN